MSYVQQPVYKCEVCGKREPAKYLIGYWFPDGWWLPDGWHGSLRKKGACFCPECYKAIQTVKKTNKIYAESRFDSDNK